MDIFRGSEKMRGSDKMIVDLTSSSSSSSSSLLVPEKKIIVTIHCNTLNLSQYISRYKGHTKIIRLQTIAERCPELQVEAYRLLIDELKRGINTTLYAATCQQHSHKLAAEYQLDDMWLSSTEQKVSTKFEYIDKSLCDAKSSTVKESIRLCYIELAQFLYDKGNLNEAIENFLRTQDYCTMSKHNCEMCLSVINAYIDLGNFRFVNTYIAKGESNDISSMIKSKLKACAGLVALHDCQYRASARNFLEVERILDFNTLMSSEDVALYGVLCSVVSFDRVELTSNVLESPSFKQYLELSPELTMFIKNFISGNYGYCLEWLEKMKPEMLLDIHLAHCAESLILLIKDKIFVQYFIPYKTLDMRKMAASLNMPVTDVENIVASLISKGQMHARIDSQTKIIHSRETNDRYNTIQKVMQLTKSHHKEICKGLLRLSLLQHGLSVSSGDKNLSQSTSQPHGKEDDPYFDSNYVEDSQEARDF